MKETLQPFALYLLVLALSPVGATVKAEEKQGPPGRFVFDLGLPTRQTPKLFPSGVSAQQNPAVSEKPPAEDPPREAAGFPVLTGLVEEALRTNPSIQAARSRWQSSTKVPSQASSLPDPELRFGSMSSPNPLPYTTLGDGPLSWASFMFAQSLPWPGKLHLKGEIADTEAQRHAQMYEATTLQVIRRLKEAYFELSYLQQARLTLERYQTLLEKVSRIAESRYAVGEGLQQDVIRSQLEISLVVERLEVLEQQSHAVRARINTLLNRSPEAELPAWVPVPADLPELPMTVESMYLAAHRANPAIEAERLGIDKASLELELSKKELWPDFTVSVNYLARGGPFDNMYEYQLGVKIPLYFWRKQRLGVEENFENLNQARHLYRNSIQETALAIKEAYVGARTAQRLVELYRSGIVPQASAALESSLSGYQVGSLDFQTVVQNALTILTYELQVQEQVSGYYAQLARLEELVKAVWIR